MAVPVGPRRADQARRRAPPGRSTRPVTPPSRPAHPGRARTSPPPAGFRPLDRAAAAPGDLAMSAIRRISRFLRHRWPSRRRCRPARSSSPSSSDKEFVARPPTSSASASRRRTTGSSADDEREADGPDAGADSPAVSSCRDDRSLHGQTPRVQTPRHDHPVRGASRSPPVGSRPSTAERRQHTEFLDFMNEIVADSADQEIHVVLDDLRTHGAETRVAEQDPHREHQLPPLHPEPMRPGSTRSRISFSILARRTLEGASSASGPTAQSPSRRRLY